jgi:hypothetical protein
MRSRSGVVLAAVLLLTVSANAPRARADAWSAAAALERQAIKVHPWDPESFRHPELYAEDGTKLTGKKRTGKERQNEPPPGPHP